MRDHLFWRTIYYCRYNVCCCRDQLNLLPETTLSQIIICSWFMVQWSLHRAENVILNWKCVFKKEGYSFHTGNKRKVSMMASLKKIHVEISLKMQRSLIAWISVKPLTIRNGITILWTQCCYGNLFYLITAVAQSVVLAFNMFKAHPLSQKIVLWSGRCLQNRIQFWGCNNKSSMICVIA